MGRRSQRRLRKVLETEDERKVLSPLHVWARCEIGDEVHASQRCCARVMNGRDGIERVK